MVTVTTMHHVSDKWLRLLRWAFIVYSLHFGAGYAYALFVQKQGWQNSSTFTFSLVLLLGIHLVYELAASIFLVRKSAWATALISFSFAVVESFVILETTGVYASPYVFAILGLTFLGGALGPYVPAGIVFTLIIGFLLGLSGLFKNEGGGTVGGLLTLLGASVAAVAGYFFWRRFYNINESPELSRLTLLLKSRQSQTEILLQSIADGVIVTDIKGTINHINTSAAKLVGWPVEESVDIDIHSVLQLNHEDGKPLEEAEDIFKRVINEKQSVNQIFQLVNRNGGKAIISLVVSPVLIPPQNEIVGMIAVLRDVSKQREEENQRAEFISTASHEMRTPVAAIEGYLALALNENVTKIDSKAREYLEKAHESTQHLGKLFQDLLTSAKAEDGRLSSHPVAFEVGEFLEKLTDGLKFAAEKKGLLMEFIIGTAGQAIDASNSGGNKGGNKMVRPLYYMQVDPERLREVITNLFDNAIKYTDQGKISIGLTGDDNVVQIRVSDTGAGIPAEDIPHLFQKFYRVDNSATRTIGGTGLGLFISRKIIELYGGRIWVESELGKGSTFYINIPRIDAQKAAQLQAAETARGPLANTSSLVGSL